MYRLGLGLVLVLVLRFCAYSYGGVYNRNTAGGELQQERRKMIGILHTNISNIYTIVTLLYYIYYLPIPTFENI